jgi:hypothetical protein
MFCPSCGAEHGGAITRCSDCDLDLVPSLPSNFADERVIAVWGGEDPITFSVAMAALKASKIPAREISQYNRLVRRARPLRPNYEIAVRAEDAARASEVIEKALDANRSE